MNNWTGNKILFVGAHADDVELGCGGWINQLCNTKNISVKVLTFSLHRPHYNGDILRKEAKKSMSILGIKDYALYDFQGCNPENDFFNQRHQIYEILESLRDSWNPSLVVTHPSNDTNQDHRQVYKEVVACFKKHSSIITFEFPNNTVEGKNPDIFIEIEESDLRKKIKALTSYRSQFKRKTHNYMDPKYIRSLAVVRGQSIAVDAAEAFNVIRLAQHIRRGK